MGGINVDYKSNGELPVTSQYNLAATGFNAIPLFIAWVCISLFCNTEARHSKSAYREQMCLKFDAVGCWDDTYCHIVLLFWSHVSSSNCRASSQGILNVSYSSEHSFGTVPLSFFSGLWWLGVIDFTLFIFKRGVGLGPRPNSREGMCQVCGKDVLLLVMGSDLYPNFEKRARVYRRPARCEQCPRPALGLHWSALDNLTCGKKEIH